MIDNIRAIYANSRSTVSTASETSDWFPETSGVKQGCNLSPLLFVLYMDQITKEANPDPQVLYGLMFEDDQAMMNNDKTQLQEHTSLPPPPPPTSPPRNLPLWPRYAPLGVPNTISLVPRVAIEMHSSYSPLLLATPLPSASSRLSAAR